MRGNGWLCLVLLRPGLAVPGVGGAGLHRDVHHLRDHHGIPGRQDLAPEAAVPVYAGVLSLHDAQCPGHLLPPAPPPQDGARGWVGLKFCVKFSFIVKLRLRLINLIINLISFNQYCQAQALSGSPSLELDTIVIRLVYFFITIFIKISSI